MSKKLYIGNLALSVSASTLEELFSTIGHVISAEVIRDSETEQSRGFGWIEMSTDQENIEAISRFNGTVIDGRQITVSEQHQRQTAGLRGGSGKKGS